MNGKHDDRPQTQAARTGKKSWHGRLTAEADAATAELLASLDVDRELWRYDIRGSRAHAEMLCRQGLIRAEQRDAIFDGLEAISEEIEAGRLDMPAELEDIHMVIEAALIERTGDAGRKLHTGRSRNDQVALDLRLWARDQTEAISEAAAELQRALVDKAEPLAEAVMPAYTHLQRAQPVSCAQPLLAYVEMLQRDRDRLADARRRIDVCPLGCGAVAGTSLELDREFTARELGFAAVAGNSIDATSDRDFLAELCFACSLLAVHLSRWAEDWILYSTTEFAFLELDDAYCTSSSMMPQKKNADTLELIRGKAAAAVGNLTGLLTLLKGLPLAYNRDLQDDKRFALPVAAATRQTLAVAAGIVRTARVRTDRIAGRLEEGFLDATALAEYLTGRGVPFREAHGVVGRLVARAESDGRTLAQMPLEDLRAGSAAIEDDVYGHLGAENVVRRYRSAGSGGVRQVREQIARWRDALGS